MCIYTYIYMYIKIFTYIHTYIHTYRQTDRQTDRQTYRQTDIHTYRHTYIHTYIHIYINNSLIHYVYIYIYVCVCICVFSPPARSGLDFIGGRFSSSLPACDVSWHRRRQTSTGDVRIAVGSAGPQRPDRQNPRIYVR